MNRCVFVGFRLLAVWVALAGVANAHFPWLATDGDGRALLFFGESPADRTYHTPDAVAEAKVRKVIPGGAESEVTLAAVDEKDLIGRRSADAAGGEGILITECPYGNYNGMLLDYHVKHILGDDLAAASASVPSKLKLDATPSKTDKGIDVLVQWDGAPLADAEVSLFAEDGEPVAKNTDKDGIAHFDAPPAGLVGLLFSRIDSQASGESNGHPYSSTADYGTTTFQWKGKDANGNAAPAKAADDKTSATSATDPGKTSPVSNSARIPPLPEPLASFGAAVCGPWLYVYSGHVGEEHDHSRDNLSNHFRRIRIADGAAAWDELPMQTPLQGLPLVSHGEKLYRVGGLSARNAAGEKEAMHSVDEFSAFDPATNEWTTLAPLPEPRSSHDAAVIDGIVYVVGGWKLSGTSPGEWLNTAWSFDLAHPESGWKEIAAPPFKRRALAVAAWGGKIVAVGGMDENQEVSRRVDQFDPQTGEWSTLPSLPGDDMDGFGVSAWSVNGDLLASSADGAVLRLARGADKWAEAGKLAEPRFFHRLVPYGAGGLLAIGGASMESGHLASIEVVQFDCGCK